MFEGGEAEARIILKVYEHANVQIRGVGAFVECSIWIPEKLLSLSKKESNG
jgi:hypothetical protein